MKRDRNIKTTNRQKKLGEYYLQQRTFSLYASI